MRIGINLSFLVAGKGGGIERHIRGVIGALQRLDHSNEYVLFTSRDAAGTFPLAPNFHEVASRVSAAMRPAKIVWEQTVLPLELVRHRIDVLLSPANLAPAIHGCPSAVIIHDMVPFLRPEVFTRVERTMLQLLLRVAGRSNDRIITVSESSKRDIVRILGVTPERVNVIPGACDPHFRPVALTSDARADLRRCGLPERYLLYVAAGRAYKNIDGLVKAFHLLKSRRGIPHALVVVGLAGRATPALERLISSLELADDVVFSGFLDDRMLPLVYSAADALVYPSFYEGFGLPVLEAMACGTPVAAANRTSLPEAVGDAGLLFDPADPEDMARVIARVLDEPALRAELVERGRVRASTFTWEKTATSTLATLTAVAS